MSQPVLFSRAAVLRGLAVVYFAIGIQAQAADNLYDALGGKEKIAAFTGDFVETVLHDGRIATFFKGVDIPRLKVRLAEQFSQLSGGPVVYSGRDMKKIHDGLEIRQSDFNALVEDLEEAMDRASVPFFTQNRLIALLAPMEREIVTK
jgi:hemoglobin